MHQGSQDLRLQDQGSQNLGLQVLGSRDLGLQVLGSQDLGLKEIDASASAIASNIDEVVKILSYTATNKI